MDKQILEKTINSLNKARDARGSQLDIGEMTELENLIAELEKLRDEPPKAADSFGRMQKVLQALAAFVSLVTDIRDWL